MERLLTDGSLRLDKEQCDNISKCQTILTSNLDNREADLMKVFDCNPEWPICIFDFTYKNKTNH